MAGTVDQVRDWAKGNDYFEGHIVQQGKDVFIPSANKWPHIHIGTNYIVYKKAANNHSYFVNPGEEKVDKGRVETARTDSGEVHIIQVCRYLESQF